ncbi:MAG: hypothetical protein EHM91_11245 [Planctomycetota bacterium]|nr:MAG: hypothetical protein EHM91_11245 [Planctomycetota bacterium]
MRMLALLALTVGVPVDETTVWVFVSPDSPEAGRVLETAKGERVRTVLLVERYFGEREPAAAFLATVRAAGELRVVDEEGLRKAKQLGIRRVPAVAVVRGNRVHVAVGTQVDVQELLRCSK